MIWHRTIYSFSHPLTILEWAKTKMKRYVGDSKSLYFYFFMFHLPLLSDNAAVVYVLVWLPEDCSLRPCPSITKTYLFQTPKCHFHAISFKDLHFQIDTGALGCTRRQCVVRYLHYLGPGLPRHLFFCLLSILFLILFRQTPTPMHLHDCLSCHTILLFFFT